MNDLNRRREIGHRRSGAFSAPSNAKILPLCLAAAIVAAAAILPRSPAAGLVVYDQPATDSFLRQSSQLGYDRFSSDYDVYVWDDFTLGTTQSISEIHWRGVYTSGGYWGGPVIDFVIGIYPSIAGGFQPDVINPPLVEYTVGSNAAETPPQPPGAMTQSFHDYDFVLPTAFVATAGTKYWLQIEAIQTGPTDWGLTAATSGTGGIFFAQAGVGDFQYLAGPGNVGLTLFGPDGPGSTPTTTETSTATASPSSTPTMTVVVSSPTITAMPSGVLVPIAGKKLLIADHPSDSTKRKIVFLSQDASVHAAGGVDPVAGGATLLVYNANGSGEAVCLSLPSGGWSAGGTPSKPSYTYRDKAFANGPCKVAAIKDGKLKAVCRAKVQPIAYSLDEPVQGAMGVRIASGGTTWCAAFGGVVATDSGTNPPIAGGKGLFKAQSASAPIACPAVPVSCP